MNSAAVVKRLYRERQEWRAAGEGAEVSWTVKGLDIALRVVHAMAKEEKIKAAARRPPLPIWLTGELFRAVTQARRYLDVADRAKAIAILDKARFEALAALQRRKIRNRNGHSISAR